MNNDPPPEIENPWLAKELRAFREWSLANRAFAGDDSIIQEQKADGRSTVARIIPARTLRPLELIASPTDANPERYRVVIGGINWGGIFMYADPDMKANEDGVTPGKEFFYKLGAEDGDKVWVEMVMSYDGFWRRDSSTIEHGPTVPALSDTLATLYLGAVNITDGVLKITKPQMLIGNFGQRRFGVASGFQDEPWPLIAADVL